MHLNRLTIPFIILAFFQYSCVKDETLPQATTAPPTPAVIPPSSELKTYLALGDSYTIGQGVPVADRYPVQTKNWLSANGIPGITEPQIIATSGWTTSHLQSAITSQNPAGPYDAVSLLIGVNDQYQGLNAEGYRGRFTQLLQKCISLANNLPSHVFVLSIPDYSVTPFAMYSDVDKIRAEIEAFNEINRLVALSFNVQYLDITDFTREAKNNPALICSDGLHPSGLEYKIWADRLGPMIKAVLQ